MFAATTEYSSPRNGSGGGIRLTITKLLFMLQYFNFSSRRVLSPPILPISSSPLSQQLPDIIDLHPIIRMMLEQELGRSIITIGVPVAAAVSISDNDTKLMVVCVLVAGMMMGSTAIWNGILFRTNFPRLANVLEVIGISLVLLSLYGLVASFLPIGFSCIVWLSGASCLVPFIVVRFYCT